MGVFPEGVVMKNTRAEICRLFVILSVLSASIWVMNDHKKTVTLATHLDVSGATTEGVGGMSIDAAYEYMNELFLAHDTYLVVQVISQFKSSSTVELVEKIIKDKKIPLTTTEKLTILFGVVDHFRGKKAVQYQLLDLLLKNPDLYKKNPALFVLARSKYVEIFPDVLQWINQQEKNDATKKRVEFFVTDALKASVQLNDRNSLEVMLNKKVRISQQQASKLLWYVVVNKKSSSFVPFLIRHAQADVNYVGDGKRTLLIMATEQKSKDIVNALLEEGAVVDRIVDPAVGSALQIAIERGYTDIELMLRDYGARE